MWPLCLNPLDPPHSRAGHRLKRFDTIPGVRRSFRWVKTAYLSRNLGGRRSRRLGIGGEPLNLKTEITELMCDKHL